MKLFIILILMIGLTGCLSNLNQAEFFRKLEIKKESWYDLVVSNQSAFESSITKYIEEETGKHLERITFWGEGRYACGKAVRLDYNEVEVLDVSGTFFVEGEKRKHQYNIRFIPREGGELESPILFY